MSNRQRIDGVDLSHHNPVTLDQLRKAKADGARFVYHKATEGDTYTDPTYPARRAMAADAGLPFGAYHFARPEVGDATAEATRFLNVAKPRPGDLIPCLDLETTEGLTLTQLITWASTFATVIRQELAVEPVIYSPYNLGLPGIRWRPRYNPGNTLNGQLADPALPWDLWQFSDGQLGDPNTIDGLGRVDLNTFAAGVTLDDLLLDDEDDDPDGRARRVRFVTQNVKALPLMPQGDVIDDVLLTARQADVIGWQEMGPDRYKDALDELPPPWSTFYAGERPNPAYNSPISYRADRFGRVAGGAYPLVEPRDNVSRARWVTWVVLEDRATGNQFMVTNLHMIAGAFGRHPERAVWWNEDRDRFVGWLEHAHHAAPGRPIVNLGDYNTRVDREPALGAAIGGTRFLYLTPDGSIDHIALLPGRTPHRVEVEVVKRDQTLGGRNSDHRGRRAVLRFPA